MSSKFSVLISIYNKEKPKYFEQALESVFCQTLPADEVVIVEDGPLTGELYAVVDTFVSKYSVIKVVKLPTNGGLGVALNEGLKHCSNDLVVRMDTDDFMPACRFERQVKFMDENPDIDVCSAWITEVSDENESNERVVVSVKKLPEKHEELYEYGKKRCPINHAAAIYRRSAVERSGGYGPYPEDYYLWVRMMVHECKFHNIQESLYNVRYNADVMRRRGGLKYLKLEYACQREMLRLGYINKWTFFVNMCIRCVVRLAPNNVRNVIYTSILRK